MITFVDGPLIVALVVAMLGSLVLRTLRPVFAARACAIILATVMIAAVPTFWIVGVSGLAHLGLFSSATDWSRHILPGYQSIGAAIGIASLTLALVGLVRAVRVIITHCRVRCCDTSPYEFVESDELFAYTLPGPAATIAVSSALRDYLDDEEFAVVIAHERAHARHRHDRLLLLGLLAKAFLPVVRPLTRNLEYWIERWADEEAFEETGTDRRVVARTIAKVALASSSSSVPSAALGISSSSVTARAEALCVPAQPLNVRMVTAAVVLVGLTMGFGTYQLHHTAMLGFQLWG